MNLRRIHPCNFVVFVFVFVLFALFGCNKEPGSIYGVVTDAATGEPVDNANVLLQPIGKSMLTGSAGGYEFLDVPVGTYYLNVTKEGYSDCVDQFKIVVNSGMQTQRDVQIEKLPSSLHLFDNESQEISELDFGANEEVKTFNIFNGGNRTINYAITKTANWIESIEQPNGTVDVGATCPVIVKINRRSLAAGDNSTSLIITSSVDGGKELRVKARKNGESPTVNVSNVLSIDSTTYRIKCEVLTDGGQEIIERGICWNTYGDPTMDDETIPYANSGLGQYTIRMENLVLSTRYYVRAYAKNSMGTGFSEVIDFRTGSVITPPSVSTVVISGVTATTANILGNISDDGGVDLIERGVCWGLEANPGVDGSHQVADVVSLGVFNVSIASLAPQTTYHVRCYAINIKGVAYGEDLSFTTAEGVPVVTTLGITSITATSAKGGGNVIDEGASDVIEKGICWSMDHNPTINDCHIGNGQGVGEYTVDMTGLTPNATYYVRAYAMNQQGTAYGAEVSFTAMEGLPVVTTLEMTDVTSNTAKAHGEVVDQGGSAVKERGVCWSVDPSPTISDNHFNSGTGVGSYTTDINGLSPGTKYYVRAYATNTQGTTYGEQKEFVTEANLPMVNTSNPANVTQTTAVGGGNVISDGGATVTERGVCWSINNNPTIGDAHVGSGSGTGTFTVSMTGLEPGTKYYVRAYAINSQGVGYGHEKQLATEANLPTVVTKEVSNLTQTTAQAGGVVTGDGGAAVTERGVCWSTSHNPVVGDSHASEGGGMGSFAIGLTGLVPNTTYYVRAYAKNSVGISYGDEVGFTTSQDISSPTVITNQVTDITWNSAIGGAVVTDDGNASVMERGICWSTGHNPTTSGSHASIGTGVGAFTVNMTGLAANTSYFVRAYAINSVGTAYGDEVSFTTLPAPNVMVSDVAMDMFNEVLGFDENSDEYWLGEDHITGSLIVSDLFLNQCIEIAVDTLRINDTQAINTKITGRVVGLVSQQTLALIDEVVVVQPLTPGQAFPNSTAEFGVVITNPLSSGEKSLYVPSNDRSMIFVYEFVDGKVHPVSLLDYNSHSDFTIAEIGTLGRDADVPDNCNLYFKREEWGDLYIYSRGSNGEFFSKLASYQMHNK